MSVPRMLLLLAGVAAIVAAVVVFRFGQSPPTSPAVPVAAEVPRAATPNSALARSSAAPVHSENTAPIRAEEVLAKVNGKAIQLRDLVALSPEEKEKSMTPDQYESRLNRAIEMELIFQSAAAQGLSLTPEQQQRLNKIAQDHQARLEQYKQQGISWSSIGSAQLEFEKRLISALMLQQNLVAKEAKVAPSTDPALQAQYEQALRDIMERLKSNAEISTGNVMAQGTAIR